MSTSLNRDGSLVGPGIVALLSAGHFLAFVDRALPSVYAPALKAEFNLSDTQLGALQGPAFVLVFALGTLLAGHGGNRLPKNAVLAGCILVWSLATIGFALAADYGALLGARLFLGLGQAAFAPTALAVLVAGVVATGQARSISVFTSGSAMGRSGALLLGGLALGVLSATGATVLGLAPWRAAVLVLIPPNLIVAGLLFWRVKTPLTGKGPTGLRAALRHVLANPLGLGLHFLAAAGVILMVQAAAAWGPSILNRAQALDPATSAVVAGVMVLIGAPLGHLTGGWMLDRAIAQGRGPARIMVGGAVLASAAAFLLAGAGDAFVAGLAFFLITAGGGAAALAALAGLQPLSPPSLQPAVSSLYLAFVSVVGVGLGPLLTGLLSDVAFRGPSGIAQALATAMLAGVVVVITAACAGASAWTRLATRARATHMPVMSAETRASDA